MTEASHDILRRLAFIRYLYLIAAEQSHQPEPLSSASILGFHDSVELFLQLASEQLNVGKANAGFMDYWALIDPKTSLGGMSQKESMRRLNSARVSLKHHGTLPSASSIEGFRASTTNFFEDNTLIVFGLAFSEISMTDLVTFEPARRTLKQAELLLAQEDHDGAMGKIAVGFEQLVDHTVKIFHDRFGRTPFYFPTDFAFDKSFHRNKNPLDPLEQGRFEDKLMKAVNGMQKPIQIMSLGLDYGRYAQFHLLTPSVRKISDSRYKVQVTDGINGSINRHPTKGACDFCLQFVIASAIRLQQIEPK